MDLRDAVIVNNSPNIFCSHPPQCSQSEPPWHSITLWYIFVVDIHSFWRQSTLVSKTPKIESWMFGDISTQVLVRLLSTTVTTVKCSQNPPGHSWAGLGGPQVDRFLPYCTSFSPHPHRNPQSQSAWEEEKAAQLLTDSFQKLMNSWTACQSSLRSDSQQYRDLVGTPYRSVFHHH